MQILPPCHPCRPKKLVVIALLLPVTLVSYIFIIEGLQNSVLQLQYPWLSSQKYPGSSCSPAAYSNGTWVYHNRTNATAMMHPEDALRFSGFQGCASSREYFWHLAADLKHQYDRFPGAQSWEWIPGVGCEDLKPLNAEILIKQLVEKGGWYLVGDSVTENHFFSLSCLLYPHVYATPDYDANTTFDRAWPQNLHLSKSSPLLHSLSIPKGFDISSTPLITFRRVDLLLSKESLIKIHCSLQTIGLENEQLFSEESVWTLPLQEYLLEFVSPLPIANYATMVVNTGGHWTTTLFSQVSPEGMDGILALFEASMTFWAQGVQDVLREYNGMQQHIRKKSVVVRAYLPGHEDCHYFQQPWSEVQPFVWNWYNWADISKFNAIFESVLGGGTNRYPDIHYLSIDHPARLRPDAHTTGDCLHIMTGAGVLEGWSHYIWHFVNQLESRPL